MAANVPAHPPPPGFPFGPYYRLQSERDTRLMLESGEAWGRPPRNIYSSDFPAVMAYNGPLPDDASGIEFYAQTRPIRQGRDAPGTIVRWNGERYADLHKIKIFPVKTNPAIERKADST